MSMPIAYAIGAEVIVLSSPDCEDYEGQVGELIELDLDEEDLPYLVRFEDGPTYWVAEVEPVDSVKGEPPQMSTAIFQVVRNFMRGRASVRMVGSKLDKKQAVIIQMNPSEDAGGYRSNGGPYIIIWHTQCGGKVKWSSRDNYIGGTNYRYARDTDGEKHLKSEVVNICENYQAFLVDLPAVPRLMSHMKERLNLDGDLFQSSTTDAEIAHSVIHEAISGDRATLLTEVQQPATIQTQSQAGETQMSNKITAIVAQAKAATVTAAEIQAGKALNIAAIKAAKAKAPMMVRGYMDHPAAPAVVALAVVTAAEFMPAGPAKAKITKAASLMLTAAVIDGADKFLDLEGMIDKVFSGLPAEAKALLDA